MSAMATSGRYVVAAKLRGGVSQVKAMLSACWEYMICPLPGSK